MDEYTFRRMTDDEIVSWYDGDLARDFAPNERKPLQDIFSLVARDCYEIWGLFENDRLLGYATLWKRTGIPLMLLDYLGVTESRRNGGLGGRILALLRRCGGPLVTESELPIPGAAAEENALRTRRIGFYRRNGFVPAYEMATCGLRWQALLANAEGLDMADVMRWHKELYGPERTDVKVPIGKDETPELPYWMR